MKNNQFIKWMLPALAVLFLLAGCGQGMPTVNPATTAPVETPTPTPTPAPTPRVITTVRGLFPGVEPAGLPEVFEALNSRLDEDILVRLALDWAPGEGYDGAVATAVAAGGVDFFWCAEEKLAGYVQQGLTAPLDDAMAEFGQSIAKGIDIALLDGMKVDGKLMGLPSAGGAPLAGGGRALTYREDLRLKHGLEGLDTLPGLERYLGTVAQEEPGLAPLCAGSLAEAIMGAFGPEMLLEGTGKAVAVRLQADGTAQCVAVQDAPAFAGAVAQVRQWYRAGWLPKDMPAIQDATAQVPGGHAAATTAQTLSAIQWQAGLAEAAPGALLAGVPLPGAAKHYTGLGGSALCLAKGSGNAGSAVRLWAWVLASQENYDLFCYGQEGVSYRLDGGSITMLGDGYGAFPSWIFLNMKYHRFPAALPEPYVEALRHWNDGAQLSPLYGFVLDPAAVRDELAKAAAVYGAYGPALNAGSAEPEALLEEFAAKMKEAGQQAIVDEAQRQVNAFLAGKR